MISTALGQNEQSLFCLWGTEVVRAELSAGLRLRHNGAECCAYFLRGRSVAPLSAARMFLGSVCLRAPECSPLSLLSQLSAPLGHGALRSDYILGKEPILGLGTASCVCSEEKATAAAEIRKGLEMKGKPEPLWWRLLWVAVGKAFLPSSPQALQ